MFHPFAVEQFLSENEQAARFNFSESGVHPLSFAELCDVAHVDRDRLFAMLVDYPEVNGTRLLRERIAAIYGADATQVLVTIGATEANTLVANTLLGAGDNIVRFRPTYEQLPGNAANRGIQVRDVDLVEARGWAVDHAALNAAVDAQTRIIHVVNPNNPTGRILSDADRDAIIAAAARVGAWIVADEVYAGTERGTDTPTRSFWGTYDRVIAINSMSKAYGLPGLRLGWMVAPSSVITDAWRRHEYASIAVSAMSMTLAEHALEPAARGALMARARRLIRRGFETAETTLIDAGGMFSVVPPEASAMSFVRFDLPVTSGDLVARLMAGPGVLVIPGHLFGFPQHFRISTALPDGYLRQGLAGILDVAADIKAAPSHRAP